MQALAGFITMLAIQVAWWLFARHGRKKGWSAFKRHGGGAVAGFVGMFVVALMLMPFVPSTPPPSEASGVAAEKAAATEATEPAAPQTTSIESEEETEKKAAKPVKTLGVTPQEYVDRLNATLRGADLPFRAKVNIEDGILRSMLSDRHALVARVDDKSGRLVDVMLMTQGDGTAASGMDVLLVGAAAISAAIPDSRIDDGLGEKVLSLASKAMETKEAQYSIRSDVKFGVSQSDQLGVWYSVSPVE